MFDYDSNGRLSEAVAPTGDAFRLSSDLELRGAVVNVSSGAAHAPLEGWAAYCSTKAALHMFTQALHLEEGERVAVYGASPGTVDTEMQVLIRASGVNPISQIPRGDLAPASLPAKGVAWLLDARPEDLRGQDVRVRDAAIMARIEGR